MTANKQIRDKKKNFTCFFFTRKKKVAIIIIWLGR